LRRGLRFAAAAVATLATVAAVSLLVTRPARFPDGSLPVHRADLANGERMYHAASCAYCHRSAQGEGPTAGLPVGDAPFATPIGAFYPGNLTPDRETGLGAWTEAQFVDAMVHGTSPDGRHYFPAFPYGSFRRMRVQDVLDLFAYLRTLPAVRAAARRPQVPLEPVARLGVGLWKSLALDEPGFTPPAGGSESGSRGAYLANGPGHCGECHTPRDLLMRPDERRHMAGGPHPAGEGSVPSLRGLVARARYQDAADLTLALQHGETFGYDKLSSGGMGAIQANLAKLPEADLRALSDYLVGLQ
jgi:mono/diheme cytochrome c family protein